MKPALYLVPGTMCDDRLWLPLKAQWPDVFYHFCDYRACSTLTEMIDEVLANAPSNAHIVGFSLGAYLAARAASKQPEKFKSLSLISPSLNGLSPAEKELRIGSAEIIRSTSYKGMSIQRAKQFLHPGNIENTELLQTITAMEQSLGQKTLVTQLLATLDRENLAPVLTALPLPTLMVGATSDAIAPYDDMLHFAKTIEHIQLETVSEKTEASGHMIPLEAPGELSSILKKWTRQHP